MQKVVLKKQRQSIRKCYVELKSAYSDSSPDNLESIIQHKLSNIFDLHITTIKKILSERDDKEFPSIGAPIKALTEDFISNKDLQRQIWNYNLKNEHFPIDTLLTFAKEHLEYNCRVIRFLISVQENSITESSNHVYIREILPVLTEKKFLQHSPGAELLSKWVGDSEKAVIALFKKAREVAPSVIFFDEIDVIAGSKSSGDSNNVVQERVLAQLLIELDGVTPLGEVVVLAATNRPDRIDEALLRPGRFDRVVYVPLPDAETRMEIFKLKFSKLHVEDVDIELLVASTENYSGAEIIGLCNVAAMNALQEDIMNATSVKMKHFEMALKKVIPRTKSSQIKLYEEFESNKMNQ